MLTSEQSRPDEAAILRHAARPVPRYTSYPTAPHFHAGIGNDAYRAWLGALPVDAALSLYLHVPFCDTLCWFCGCHTKITRQYAPVAAYMGSVRQEIAAVAAAAPAGPKVSHMHWGGGSPTILAPDDMHRVADALHAAFAFAPDAEFAIEVDPRGLDAARVDALAAIGLTRVSLGVQDFDPAVQEAINRRQSFEETERVAVLFRDAGVASLNIDALYGLPGQGMAQLLHTLGAIVRLRPDRIALFGYAHVPWMKRHQRMIDEAALPGLVARHAQAETAAAFLVAEGYCRIGIDHFALPDDALARAARQGGLRRNFQGYTVDPADALIGLGASAIAQLPQGYLQNETAIGRYRQRVEAEGLAVSRGFALGAEDRMRAHAIERLMCDLEFSTKGLRGQFGQAADALAAEAREMVAADDEGLVAATADGFTVTERGRPFVRTIAARFDAYLGAGAARHSAPV